MPLHNDDTGSPPGPENAPAGDADALREPSPRLENDWDGSPFKILEPEGDIGVLNLGDIIDAPALQAMMDDFYRLTQIGCAVVDLAGKILVAVGWQDVCTRFHRVHPETLKNCVESDSYLSIDVPAGTFKAYRCKNHMWDIATPIKVGGRHLGNFFLGQFFFTDEAPDDALFRSQARQYGFDEETYLEALHRAPRWSRETIDAVMSFYAKLAGMISSLGYGTLRLSRALTQQKTALDQLAISEEKYRRISENISDVVWITDLDLKTTYVSPSIQRLSGESPEVHVQRTVAEKFPPEALTRLYAVLAEELEKEKDPACDKNRSRLIEVQYYRADGILIWIEINISAVRDEAGNLTGLQGVTRDITESKRMEEALRASEERFRLLSDVTMEGILIHQNGIVKELNASLAKLLGYARDELLGKNILELAVYPDDESIARENIVKEYAQPYIVRAVRKDGSVFYAEIEARNFPLKDEVLRVAAVRDVTERMASREALRSSEERYRDLFENVSDFLYFHDLDGNFLETNRAFRHAHGYSPEELEKINARDLMPEKVRPEFDAYLQRMVANGQDEGLFPVVHKDGSVIIAEYKNLLVRDAEGKPIGVRGSARDITAKIKAERKSRQLEANLHQTRKMEAMGRMAGAVAHHFNNQLAVVQGNLELAMGGLPADPKIRALLNEAMQAAGRSAEISTLMLTYLGQTAGKGAPLDLSAVCRGHVPSLREKLPDGIAIETDLMDVGPVVRGVEHRIHQVLTHLVANAAEAIGEGGGRVTLTTRTIAAGEIPKSRLAQVDWQPVADTYACLEVSDSGCGIGPEAMGQIFDPFFTTKFTGRGLGLAVVMGIVRACDGVVGVESTLDQGSVFRLFLPVDATAVARPAPGATPARRTVTGATILLVEDQAPVRKMAETMLGRLGYAVLGAADGAAALDLFDRHREAIGCVVTDLTMPGMDGWQVLEALRRIEPALPVILCSGYDEAGAMGRDAAEKPDAFLPKPYSKEALKTALGSVLGARSQVTQRD